MARKHIIVSAVRRLAATEVDNAEAAAGLMAEISAIELIPHGADGQLIPPTDEGLFSGGGEDNSDCTPEHFLASGLAARLQLALMSLPADQLLALLIPQAPADLRGTLSLLGEATILDCYRRVRK